MGETTGGVTDRVKDSSLESGSRNIRPQPHQPANNTPYHGTDDGPHSSLISLVEVVQELLHVDTRSAEDELEVVTLLRDRTELQVRELLA